jgi:hypothetical protein
MQFTIASQSVPSQKLIRLTSQVNNYLVSWFSCPVLPFSFLPCSYPKQTASHDNIICSVDVSHILQENSKCSENALSDLWSISIKPFSIILSYYPLAGKMVTFDAFD